MHDEKISSRGKYRPPLMAFWTIVCSTPRIGSWKLSWCRNLLWWRTDRYRARSHGLKTAACNRPEVNPQFNKPITLCAL
jgi:hypothetical protein